MKKSCEAGISLQPKSRTMYLPLINKTSSSPVTMLTVIKTGLEIVTGAGQTVLVFTVDQQLYKVVIDLLFHNPTLFNVVLPLCVGMHWLMNVIHAVCVFCYHQY